MNKGFAEIRRSIKIYFDRIYIRFTSNDLIFILVICGLFRLLFYLNLENTDGWFPDTHSYIEYPYNVLKGEIDDLRTPVYPYFINIVRYFGGANFLLNVKIVQSIMSFLTIIAFYVIAKSIFKTRAATNISTTIFGINPSIINNDFCVLTESLSINLAVLFLLMVVLYIRNPNIWKSILMSIFPIILVMLRPSFLFLVGVLPMFWIFRLLSHKKENINNLVGLLTSLLVIVFLTAYSRLNYSENDCNSISSVSTINQFVNLRNYGLIDDECDNELAKAIIEYNSDNQTNNTFANFPIERISKFIRCTIIRNFTAYSTNTWHKVINLGDESTVSILALNKNGFWGIPNMISNLLSLRFFTLYILLLFDLLFILYSIIKYKRILWIRSFIWVFIIGQFLTTIIGGYSEYQRLFSIALPSVTLLFFYYFDMFIFAIEKSKLRDYIDTINNNALV